VRTWIWAGDLRYPQSVARRWRVLRRVTRKLVVIVLRLLPGLPIQGQDAPANRTVVFGRE
jgi:hypothetical protein